MPDSAPKNPILCLHGLFAGGWVFDGLRPLLAARGHEVIAPDLRCAGRDHPRCSMAEYVSQAAATARALDRPIIIGHSMGGLIAQILAARGLARAVALVCSAPPRGIPMLSPPLLARMGRYLPALLFSRPFVPTPSDLDALVLNAVPPERRASFRRRLVPDSGRAAREIAIGRFGVRASDVRVPVFVLGASDDRFVPVHVATRLAERFRVPTHIAPGHGHFLFGEPGWEHEVTRLLDWIDSLAAAHPASAPEPEPAPRD